jgi:uncharacterized tellurite resistance protein B-like protein
MSLLRWLKLDREGNTAPSSETDTIRKITRALDQLRPEKAKFVAAFAYLLNRVARADLVIEQRETEVIERIVMEHGQLPEDQAIIAVQIAKTQNVLFGGTENYLVSREFGELATPPQKLALLDCLFAVAAADGSVSTVEDNEISQIADELRIEHRDFIRVRSRYRDYLAVLRNEP